MLVSVDASALGATLTDFLDDIIDDYVNDKGPLPYSALDLDTAASDLQKFIQNRYDELNSYLNGVDFLTSVFSNYGLLEAFEDISFTIYPSDQLNNQMEVFEQSVTHTAWVNLLPRVFQWQNVDYDMDASTTYHYRNFVPYFIQYSYEEPNPDATFHSGALLRSKETVQGQWSNPDAVDQVEFLAQSAQNGLEYHFPGFDPSDAGAFGPGPISRPVQPWETGAPTAGLASRFYALPRPAACWARAATARTPWTPPTIRTSRPTASSSPSGG